MSMPGQLYEFEAHSRWPTTQSFSGLVVAMSEAHAIQLVQLEKMHDKDHHVVTVNPIDMMDHRIIHFQEYE